MHLISSIVSTAMAAAFLAAPVHANFFLYAASEASFGMGFDMWIFKSAPGHASCNDVNNARLGIERDFDRDDVSGRSGGVRCDGDCLGDPSGIDQIEMNMDWGHFTYYKDRDMGLYTTDNRRVGYCRPTSEDSYSCTDAFLGGKSGKTKIWCSTEVFP